VHKWNPSPVVDLLARPILVVFCLIGMSDGNNLTEERAAIDLAGRRRSTIDLDPTPTRDRQLLMNDN
jgi:hypothetical protein